MDGKTALNEVDDDPNLIKAGLSLSKAFLRIKDPEKRASLLKLAEFFASEDDAKAIAAE